MSPRLLSPAFMKNDSKPQSYKTESTTSSMQLHRNGQDAVSDDSDLNDQGRDPVRSTGRTSQEDRSSPSLLPAKDAEDAEDDSEPKLIPKRSLRRSLRTRRIEKIASNSSTESLASAPPARQEKLLPGAVLSNGHEDTAPPAINPWKRQTYPVQLTTAGSTTECSAHMPDEGKSEIEHGVFTGSASLFDKHVYPLQPSTSGSTTLTASAPASGSAPNNGKQPSAQQDEKGSQAEVSKPRHRKLYPLQAPASHANLRRSPSPPPSLERNAVQDIHVRAKQRLEDYSILSGSKSFRRRVYPLQAPASHTNLRGSPSPPSSPDSVSEHATPKSQPNASDQAARRSKTYRRHAYPLQASASFAHLQQSPTPPQSESESETRVADHTITTQIEVHDQSTTGSKQFRRHAYPLQAAANPVNAQHLPLSQRPAFQNESDAADQGSPDQARGHTHNTVGNTSSARSSYPLQVPAVPVLEQSPPTPPTESTEPEVEHEATIQQPHASTLAPSSEEKESSLGGMRALQSREQDLATKVLHQWRRQAYPAQSPKGIPPFLRPTTPQPPWEEPTRKGPIHLPKNIQAVKDSEKHEYMGRTIVVCLDGTGDKFDNDNSNIVHLVSALKKDDKRQVSYYQAGIGTYSKGGLSSGFEAALDMAVGSGLGLHVRDAYHFLMHTYKEGDKICIFGFSRGAYTARCLAGMIHKVGLLPPRNIQQIPFAYEFYAKDTREGWQQSADFKKTFCIDVNVHFLGCFDSVASVGFIPRQLPLSSTPTNKSRYFRHAMALDERRAKFKICRHQKKRLEDIETDETTEDEIANVARQKAQDLLPNLKSQDDTPPGPHRLKRFDTFNHPNVTDEEYRILSGHDVPFETDVLEVWFAGAHADVGGGAVPNDERHKLAQIPLRWMIRQAFECDTGIIFKTKVLAEFGLDVHTLWPRYERLHVPTHGPPPSFLEKYDKQLPDRSVRRDKLVAIDKWKDGEDFYHLKGHADEDWTPEQVEDFYDVMSPLNDQLVQAPNWWVLEFMPVQYKVPLRPGEVAVKTGMNLGRYRGVEDLVPKVHWTVMHRAQQMGYKIQVRTAAHTTWTQVV